MAQPAGAVCRPSSSVLSSTHQRSESPPASAGHGGERAEGPLGEQLWQLFIDSGYFSLAGKSAAWFEPRRSSFLALSRRVARLPHLMHQTVWPCERGVQGTLSALRAYRSTWLLHQLARRHSGPRGAHTSALMLRELYARALQRVQAAPGFQWLAAYIESTVPFVHRTHLRFAQRFEGSGRVLLLPLRMEEVDCSEPGRPGAQGLAMGPATPRELARLVEQLSLTRPPCYVQALDLSREALDLEQAARPWREAGLERERHWLVARSHQGLPLLAAMLEVGQQGTNAFGLLDTVRLFPLAPQGQSASAALLEEARRWFARRGRSSFTLLHEAEGGGPLAEAHLHGAHAEARPYLWLISADLVPEFLEHIHEQTAGRLPNPQDEKELS